MPPHSSTDTETTTLDSLYYRSFVSDLRAAAWCEEHRGETSDAKLATKFGSIHELFLRNIDRSRPELFRRMDRGFLVDVVRKWMDLYLCTLDELRGRFPRTEDSADLEAVGHNWSERLGIAYEGLDRLDVASRYAELWAERSVTWATTRARGEGVYESYAARVAFVGSPFYRLVDHLKRGGAFQLLDVAGNGVTSFDLHAALVGLDEPSALQGMLPRLGWHVVGLPDEVLAQLFAAAKGEASGSDREPGRAA